jgi:hypothetical protein
VELSSGKILSNLKKNPVKISQRTIGVSEGLYWDESGKLQLLVVEPKMSNW